MEKIKIKADKHMPAHYHLIDFITEEDRMKVKIRTSITYSDYYKGNAQILVMNKKISNL